MTRPTRAPATVAFLVVFTALSGCTMVRGVPGAGAAPSPRDRGGGARTEPRVAGDLPPADPGDANPVTYEQDGQTYHIMKTARGYVREGWASWYGADFHGKTTASGEPYDMHALTAAHRTLPLPTYVRVTNLENGKSVVVRVNDRGPFHDPDRRIIDLSYAAARALDMIAHGTARVRVRAVDPPGRDRPDGQDVGQASRCDPVAKRRAASRSATGIRGCPGPQRFPHQKTGSRSRAP